MKVRTLNGQFYNLYADMLEQTNLLIAGRTGAGKSTVMDGIILTAMVVASPYEKQFIFVDNKMMSFGKYKNTMFCHYYASTEEECDIALQITYDTCMQRAKYCQKHGMTFYDGSHVYLVIDELPNLLIGYPERIKMLTRIMNICRACNVSVIVGCQNFLSQSIPTPIKVNFTAICGLQVRNASDSRVVIGESGLEKLPEHGLCYYITPKCNGCHVKVSMYRPENYDIIINHWTGHIRPHTSEKMLSERDK